MCISPRHSDFLQNQNWRSRPFLFFIIIAAILAATKAFHLLPRLKNKIQQKWGKTRPASIRCPLITPLRRNSSGRPTLIVKMELSALTTHNFPREENCCMLHSKERAKNRVQRLYNCCWQCLNWSSDWLHLIQYLLGHETFRGCSLEKNQARN